MSREGKFRWLRLALAFAFGLAVSLIVYDRATDVERGQRRAREEAAVYAARELLVRHVGQGAKLRIVDPLAPHRAIGKSYVYPAGGGYQVSGFYRREESDRWHPFLLTLAEDLSLSALSVRDDDEALRQRTAADPRLQVEAASL